MEDSPQAMAQVCDNDVHLSETDSQASSVLTDSQASSALTDSQASSALTDSQESSALTDSRAKYGLAEDGAEPPWAWIWGKKAQKRIKSANILIIKMDDLGCKVANDLILAGIKSMTILDNDIIKVQRPGKYDKMACRAEVAAKQCRKLNPMVQITADIDNEADKPDEFFSNFDVVFATNTPIHQLARIDAVCRANNTLFFCGDVFDMFGYIFLDLNVHTFETDTEVFVGVKVTTKTTSKYVSFQDFYDVNWVSEANAKKLTTMDPCYFLMKILFRFREEKGRSPTPHVHHQDIKTLRKLNRKEFVYVPMEKVLEQLITTTFCDRYAICKFLGVICAQEIIKAITHKGPLIDNFFFVNPLKRRGFADHIGTHFK